MHLPELPPLNLDAPTLKLILAIVGGLLLIAMVRILFLLRTNSRLLDSTAKMEKQVLAQQNAIMEARQDSNAWRGELQRMFDAFRAEFSNRLVESEQRCKDIQLRYDAVAKSAAVATPEYVPPSFSKPEPVKTTSVLEELVLPSTTV